MKVYIESLGCESNLADTNRIMEYFKINNVKLTTNYKEADFIILMSCGFNNIMMKDNLRRLQDFKKTDAKIILGGCIPKIRKEIIKTVDYSFGPKELEVLDQIFRFKNNIKNISPQFYKENKKIIRISTGCNGNCSYCAIKIANGLIKSRSFEYIKKDIDEGIKEGYSHFILVSEDNGSWGTDIGTNIIQLIEKINKIKGDFRITLTTINPVWFIKFPELINSLKSKKIEKKIYLALQSGSNRILKLMNRHYTVEQYKEVFNALKEEIPEIKIQTDVLIGFPTETEQDFLKTLQFVKETDINFLQVFAYTDMKGTKSYNITPKVPRKIIEERAKRIISEFLEKKKGISGRTLVNTNLKNIYTLLKKA